MTLLTESGCPDGYDALSYCWGASEGVKTICLNGVPVRISINLEAALRCLRHSNETRLLWVDALCINQNDITEKSHQVEKMLDIYGAANGVFAWLGPETEATAAGMTILNDMVSGKRYVEGEPSWTSLPPDLVRPGLDDILRRAYFTRLWVVQETAIAREVMLVCGAHTVSWVNKVDVVWPIMRRLKAALIAPQWRATGVENVRLDLIVDLLQMQLDTGPESSLWRKTRPAPDLLDVAYEARHKNSSDPRDRFYALLRLANRNGDESIKPDYSAPVQHVYNQIAEQYLGDFKSFGSRLSPDDMDNHANLERPSTLVRGNDTQIPNSYDSTKSMRDAWNVRKEMKDTVETTSHIKAPNHVETPTPDEWPPSFKPKDDPQLEIILNYVETTLQRTKELIRAGSVGRSACLIEQMGKDLRSCANTWAA